MADNLGDKHANLMARIDAAKGRLAEENRMEWAEVGHILEGLSHELNQAEAHDHAVRASIYARVEGELASLRNRLSGAAPKP